MHDVEQLRTHVIRLCRAFLLAFVALSLWLAYWQVIRAPQLRADRNNPRAAERVKLTEPGRLLTHDGKPVLASEKSDEGWVLEYPGHDIYAHLTGYNASSGLQAPLHDALYSLGKYEDPVVTLLRGRPAGCDIALTINSRAQAVAQRMLQGQRGAVIALDPRNGAIRVMVSAPDYDPPAVLESPDDFTIFQNNPERPELNRALLGQYAPGSVLKILTAAAAIDTGFVKPTDRFHCSGQATVGGAVVHCRLASGHGMIPFSWAFADSCNVIFAEVGRGMGPAKFREYVARFRLLDPPGLPLLARGGRMAEMAGRNADVECAEAAFGQGATLVTPLAIARLSATIAAGGVVMAPKLIERITNSRGRVVMRMAPESLGAAVTPETARVVTQLMVETVDRGTGQRAQISGVKVAGKTGSAENPAGLPHAWFTGFAPADKPVVAVAVIIENGGAGGEVSAPIARQVMEALLNAERPAEQPRSARRRRG